MLTRNTVRPSENYLSPGTHMNAKSDCVNCVYVEQNISHVKNGRRKKVTPVLIIFIASNYTLSYIKY